MSMHPLPVTAAPASSLSWREVALLLPFAGLLVILPFPGTVAARLLFLLLAFLIAAWQVVRKPGAWTHVPNLTFFLAWVSVCLLSMNWAIDPPYSWRELQNELGYTMMAFFAFFVIGRERRYAIWLLRAFAAGLLLIGVPALLAWLANGRRWVDTGMYGGTGTFISYVVNLMPALFWLACTEAKSTVRRAMVGLAGFAVLLAGISLQRVAWPALVAQGLVALLVLRQVGHARVSSRRLAIASLTVIVLGLGGLLASQQVRYGFTAVPGTFNTPTTDIRLQFWPTVLAKIGEHPLAGPGFGRRIMQKAYPEMVPLHAPDVLHAHNMFLNYGLGMGLPGIVVLMTLMLAWGVFFWRAAFNRQAGNNAAPPALWAGAGLLLVVGLVTRNQFNDFFMRDASMLFWALLGLFARRVIEESKGDSA